MRSKTKMDRFGRVVIPKKIRQAMGIKTDTEVYLETRDNGILMIPNHLNPIVKEDSGIMVVCSEPLEEFTDFIDRDRQERIRKIVKGLDY